SRRFRLAEVADERGLDDPVREEYDGRDAHEERTEVGYDGDDLSEITRLGEDARDAGDERSDERHNEAHHAEDETVFQVARPVPPREDRDSDAREYHVRNVLRREDARRRTRRDKRNETGDHVIGHVIAEE